MPLQPLQERVDRKFAHSLKFALPKRIAPAARRRAAKGASAVRNDLASAKDPAVVATGSRVSMLSLTIMGMPCRDPRAFPDFLSESRARAALSAFGLRARTERYPGPC